ncbi:MAG: ABC transporter ATP-binding protein [candidate division WOR-3 bacterium]
MNPILSVKNLKKVYGKFLLDNISFDIFEKEMVGFLGPNGSGKTTTIKLIMNSVQKDGGEIIFDGKRVEKDNVEFRRNIGYMPESGTPYEFLTGREYIDFILGVFKVKKDENKIDELFKIFNLKEEKKKIGKYSKGMKQKLLFISAIIHNPKLLILDEPFNAVEPQTAFLMKNILNRLKSEGTSILFSTHTLEIVEKLSDRVILLNDGKKVGEGEIGQIKQEGGVEEFFNRLVDSSENDDNLKKIIEIIKE